MCSCMYLYTPTHMSHCETRGMRACVVACARAGACPWVRACMCGRAGCSALRTSGAYGGGGAAAAAAVANLLGSACGCVVMVGR